MNNNENNLEKEEPTINQQESTNKSKSHLIPIVVTCLILLLAISFSAWFITKNIGTYAKKHTTTTKITKTTEKINYDYKLVKLGDYNQFTNSNPELYEYNGYIIIGDQGPDYAYSVYKDNKLIKNFDGDDYGRLYESNGVYYFIQDAPDNSIYRNINLDNFEPSKVQYDEFEVINKNAIVVKKDNKYAIVDINDKEIIKFGEYDAIYTEYIFSNNPIKYAFVYKNNKVGIVNEKGQIVVPLKYDRYLINDDVRINEPYYGTILNDYSEKILFKVNKGDHQVILNEQGKELFNLADRIYKSEQRIYNISKKSISVYNYEGKLLYTVDMKNKKFINITEQGNIVYKGNKSFYWLDVNKNTKKLGNLPYYIDNDGETDEEYIKPYLSDAIRVVEEKNKYKIFANKNDKLLGTYEKIIVIEFTNYDEYREFIVVEKNKKAGLLDAYTGEVLIPIEYDLVNIRDDVDETSTYEYSMDYVFKKGNIYYGVDYYGEIRKIETEEDGIQDYMYFFKKAMLIDHNLYNYKFEKIYDKKITNWEELDNGLLIITSSNDINAEQSDYTTVVFNGDQLLNYENKDDAKLYLYAGSINNKEYFITDKGVYYLTNE